MQHTIHCIKFSSLRTLATLLVLLCLAACSGGGGGSNFGPRVDHEAAGVWSGTITSDAAGGPLQLSGVVTETGDVQFTSPDGGIVYTGTVQVDRDKITGTLEGVNFAGFLPGAVPAGRLDIDGPGPSPGALTGPGSGAGSGAVARNDRDT